MPTAIRGWSTVTIMEVRVADLTFDVDVTGPPDGRPVLLLHGFPESRGSWRRVVPALAESGYRCIVPDQRGYSPKARPHDVSAYALPYLVADALGIAEVLGAPIVDLVGHDWGGMVAWTAAARYPDRVRSLVTVSTPHPAALAKAMVDDADQQARSAYVRRFRDSGFADEWLADDAALMRAGLGRTGLPEEIVDEYVAYMRAPGRLDAALNWYRAIDTRLEQNLPPVTVPTTYVWGDQDPAFGPGAARATRSHVTGPYTFVRLAGTGHWIPENAPEALVRAILAQLRSS